MNPTVEPNAPPEGDLEGDLPPVIRPERDYSQRPQRPIKLKPSIARERSGAPAHAGSPREVLESDPPVPLLVAEPGATTADADGLPQDVQEAVVRAATLAGLPPGEWVNLAAQALEEREAANGPVTNEEVILHTLREMNLRLAALERPRGLLQWARRVVPGHAVSARRLGKSGRHPRAPGAARASELKDTSQ
jgi:hypothetical protein